MGERSEPFQPGDRIRCIDPKASDIIKKGHVYTILRIDETIVYLAEFELEGYNYWIGQFELYKGRSLNKL